jgi:hypothetical protein
LRHWQSDVERLKDSLVLDVDVPDAPPLSDFDQIAGKLTLELKSDGKLSKPALLEVTKALDAGSWSLLENSSQARSGCPVFVLGIAVNIFRISANCFKLRCKSASILSNK